MYVFARLAFLVSGEARKKHWLPQLFLTKVVSLVGSVRLDSYQAWVLWESNKCS